MLHNPIPHAALANLPSASRVKALTIIDRASTSHGAVLAATERASAAREAVQAVEIEKKRQIDGNAALGRKLPKDDIDRFEKLSALRHTELDRLEALKNTETERWQTNARLKQRATEWVGNPAHARLKSSTVKPPKGNTVEQVRSEIQRNAEETERVKHSPARSADLIQRITKSVDEITTRGAPSIDRRIRGADPANLAHALMIAHSPNSSMLLGDAGASFFVWLMRDQIIERLSAIIGKDAPDALSDAERETQLSKLAARKLELERIEEALIEQAEAEGRHIARREDADIRAILGVEVV